MQESLTELLSFSDVAESGEYVVRRRCWQLKETRRDEGRAVDEVLCVNVGNPNLGELSQDEAPGIDWSEHIYTKILKGKLKLESNNPASLHFMQGLTYLKIFNRSRSKCDLIRLPFSFVHCECIDGNESREKV